MRDLLLTTDCRRLELVETLLENDSPISMNHLAILLDSSVRNLHNDIEFINQLPISLYIETSKSGLLLIFEESTNIRDFYRSILKLTPTFQILEEIFFDETLSVSELSTILEMSDASTYRLIKKINQHFSQYNAAIQTNPCQFVGDERFIRRFYQTYFKEIIDGMDWPFRNLHEDKLDRIFNDFLKFFGRFSEFDLEEHMDFAFYDIVKLMVAVNYTRYTHGHLAYTVSGESTFMKIITNTLYIIPVSNSLKAIGVTKLTPELMYQIFYPYYKKNIAYSKSALENVRKHSSLIDSALTFIHDYIQELADTLGIAVDIEEIEQYIYGTTYLEEHDPNAYYILYNHNGSFLKKFQNQVPHIYNSLYKGIVQFREKMHLSTEKNFVQLLLYTVIIHWDNLLIDIYKKYEHLQLLVISDRHHSHSEMIQYILIEELNFNIQVDCYKDRYINSEIINNLNYDLIISTFPLPDEVNTPSVVIDTYPYKKDFDRIKSTMSTIKDKAFDAHIESFIYKNRQSSFN